MEYIYGALVLHAAGKPVNEENLKKVLTAAGVKVDETRGKALTAAREGRTPERGPKARCPDACRCRARGRARPREEGREEERGEEGRREGLRRRGGRRFGCA